MFKFFVQSFSYDKDYSERSQLIDAYTRVLEGRLYDDLPYFYWNEYDAQGNYIPLTQRQPSVNTNLCKLVVDDSVSLTFGSDHFPGINCENKQKREFAEALIKACLLQLIMIEAATTGSVGSVVILMRIIKGKPFFETKNTRFLTPFYDENDPTTLIAIREQYKVDGQTLLDMGFNIEEPKKKHWYRRVWTNTEEIIYQPVPTSIRNPNFVVNKKITHNLGFVPAVWIQNLPRPSAVDGYCTFEPAINTNIEMDYQLSQAGRGLKYSADPSVVLKLKDSTSFNDNNAQNISSMPISLNGGGTGNLIITPFSAGGGATEQKKVIRSSSNALVIGEDEDVKMLEISGEASRAVMEYVRFLRELALESIHGNRANADKVNAAQSGKAMQAMNQPLIWLADKLRITYGTCGLIPLIQMACKATQQNEIILNGKRYRNIDSEDNLSLIWSDWYPKTASEKLQEAQTIKIHRDNANMSQDTAINAIAKDYDVEDKEAEKAKIATEQAALNAQNPKLTEIITR